jgi:hypothetical protein
MKFSCENNNVMEEVDAQQREGKWIQGTEAYKKNETGNTEGSEAA